MASIEIIKRIMETRDGESQGCRIEAYNEILSELNPKMSLHEMDETLRELLHMNLHYDAIIGCYYRALSILFDTMAEYTDSDCAEEN